MGLDIYCRWGNTSEDDGMTEAEREAQFTGFVDAPAAGYLRYNWTGVAAASEMADAIGIPSPIRILFPEWNGSNGEELPVAADQIERLMQARSEFQGWLDGGTPGLDKLPDDAKTIVWFVRKIQSTIVYIDFVRAHQDRDKLRIEFN